MGSPPLPAPLLDRPVVEYVELGAHRLLLEERIASGSYGDIYRGTIALKNGGEREEEGVTKSPPTQIVAKVLNGESSAPTNSFHVVRVVRI